MRSARASRPRLIAAIAIAVAILFRLAVPTGWMPAADQAFLLVPCPDQGVALPPRPAGHGAHATPDAEHDHQGAGDKQPCPFAGAVMPFDLPPLGPDAAAAPAPVELALSRPGATSVGQGLAAPPPPSTGPPPSL